MNSSPPHASVRRYFRIDRRRIAYLKFILESYEGLAMMRTIDPRRGTIELMIAPGCETEVGRILENIRSEMRIEKMQAAD